MKVVWALVIAVVLAGFVAILWPSEGTGEVTPAVGKSVRHGANQIPVKPAAPPAKPDKVTSPALPPAAETAIAPRSDGSIAVDGRFTMLGAGTQADPFRISWPLLASAGEVIDVKAGRLQPPPQIDFLNGQWVQIDAYLAPPLWGEETRELLVMFNRWDGCCIGLPPTALDCIEASLAEPLKLGQQHSISFGTVRGRLVVEPFATGGFLLGLYRLEEASLAK
ncbi:MAG: hypothetical protein RLZZ558_744 [Planctomycetota bacterium]